MRFLLWWSERSFTIVGRRQVGASRARAKQVSVVGCLRGPISSAFSRQESLESKSRWGLEPTLVYPFSLIGVESSRWATSHWVTYGGAVERDLHVLASLISFSMSGHLSNAFLSIFYPVDFTPTQSRHKLNQQWHCLTWTDAFFSYDISSWMKRALLKVIYDPTSLPQ